MIWFEKHIIIRSRFCDGFSFVVLDISQYEHLYFSYDFVCNGNAERVTGAFISFIAVPLISVEMMVFLRSRLFRSFSRIRHCARAA